ncbi:hypothetical protein SUNI508_03135 [Seiridium unicorne]|uniref:DUF7514 domain-containing protein n=1 Tax=Seiridium unicorne TaxID=138068 RepID=A0ABR2VH22_9PEZI
MATETRTQAQTEEPTSAQTHPPPPSPPTSPPAQSTGKRKQVPADGKLFYGYLFNKDKTPTALLDALLRAIGKYIESDIGDKNHTILDKSKLAAFYKAVGGDYDSLFVNAPDKSISYIWQALGVQHTLQPTADNFAEPSVPALTLKGFVRWESLQILLGPEEHVPFIQFAVRNWALRHPDTGVPFPSDLPSGAFPGVCDPQIDQWHKDCAKRLRVDAAPAPEKPTHATSPDPRVHFSHVHAGGPPRHGPEMDYFERQRPNVPFIHIPGRPGAHHSQSPHKRRVDSSSSSSVDERARRRRSFSDYPSPQHEKTRPPSHLDPHRPEPVRRHSSQARRHSPLPSESDSDDGMRNPRTRVHRPSRPPLASVRVFPPESPISPPVPQGPARPSHRTQLRQDNSRRQSLPSGHFGIRQKVMSFLPGSHDRQRSTSRSDRDNDSRPNSARLRPDHPSSRHNRRYSDEADSSDASDSDVSRKHRNHREREREREREKVREREQRERELEEERERRSRKDRAHLRPGLDRRTSSAADIERKRREWDVRDRYRDRDREREHGRDPRDPRANLTGDERQRRSWRERERERERERGDSPVVTGVSGRKYPTDNLKPAWS